MKVTRERKLTVFRKFTSTTCPACSGDKARLHWLCIPCQAVAPWHARLVLGIACAAHVLAAEAHIRAAKANRQ